MLSTSVTSYSEGPLLSLQLEKDIGELEEKIIRLQGVKIENNDEIETSEEELFAMEKVVRARSEYNDHLKR